VATGVPVRTALTEADGSFAFGEIAYTLGKDAVGTRKSPATHT
jgi:hypothetical protein